MRIGRDFNFYCAWFCPYAQRAWMVLKELGVEHKYVEALGVFCVCLKLGVTCWYRTRYTGGMYLTSGGAGHRMRKFLFGRYLIRLIVLLIDVICCNYHSTVDDISEQ